MAVYKDLNSLFKHLQQKVIPDVLENEVHNTVVKVESDMVQEHVYNAYDPTPPEYDGYERRGKNGGLADPKNHMGWFTYSGINQVNYMIQNTTTGKNQSSFRIAGLVEYGHDNGYGKYQYPYRHPEYGSPDFLKPRRFTYETKLELQRTLEHVDAFKRGLKRHNIRTYK